MLCDADEMPKPPELSPRGSNGSRSCWKNAARRTQGAHSQIKASMPAVPARQPTSRTGTQSSSSCSHPFLQLRPLSLQYRSQVKYVGWSAVTRQPEPSADLQNKSTCCILRSLHISLAAVARAGPLGNCKVSPFASC